ncbi:MAG: cystathionine gamma-synthase [Gammaproteobacteria bacterium]|jgi:cystathionine gamma-synthase
MAKRPNQSLATLLAQGGHFVDAVTGAIVPPIHTSTTYARNDDYELPGYVYSRYDNPTYGQLESVLAELEGAADALVFASGLAGVATFFDTVRTGEHIVAPRIMYQGAQDWLRRLEARRGIDVSLFDATQPLALAGAIRPGQTAVVWIEASLNPTWDVIDVRAAAECAHAAGAILAVDATVTPPVTLRALDLGADVVFHSATKYLAGHSDVTAGVLATKHDDERWADIKLARALMGGVIGPFEAWLLLRGMRTLHVRYERQAANALAIASHFEHHPKLEAVLYPGLASHPGHAVAQRQMSNGFGAMLSLLVRGDAQCAKHVATGTKLFVPATSLGGVESLIEHRASVEGPHSVVPTNLLRLSVGIENVHELIADLEHALDRVG